MQVVNLAQDVLELLWLKSILWTLAVELRVMSSGCWEFCPNNGSHESNWCASSHNKSVNLRIVVFGSGIMRRPTWQFWSHVIISSTGLVATNANLFTCKCLAWLLLMLISLLVNVYTRYLVGVKICGNVHTVICADSELLLASTETSAYHCYWF